MFILDRRSFNDGRMGGASCDRTIKQYFKNRFEGIESSTSETTVIIDIKGKI